MAKLFGGLRFFFYPSGSIHPLNKIKSSVCSRYGAIIQTHVGEDTTHVIVAPSHVTPIFWKLIRSESLEKECCIVNDQWPSDCVQQKQLLPTTKYLVTPPSVQEPIESQKTGSERSSIIAIRRAHREPALYSPVEIAKPVKAAKPEGDCNPQSPNSGLPANQLLIDVFHDLMMSREANGDDFSARAYRRALAKIEKVRVTICSGEHAHNLLDLSVKLCGLIDDILVGKLPPSVSKFQQKRIEIIRLFASVHGIGPYTARKLYNAGHRTLADIRPLVDENSRVSIDYHGDFVERMSRTEVAQHFAVVQKLLHELDPDAQAMCMGSYRRGKLDCGDIDIILTKMDTEQNTIQNIFKRLRKKMFDTGFAVYTFSEGTDRWLGATQVIGRWRRMDILLVPWDELGAANIYYTGNDMFNRRLRYMAKQRGMRLNQNGLFKKEPSGKLILLESFDEKRIMEILGHPYLPPEERNIV